MINSYEKKKLRESKSVLEAVFNSSFNGIHVLKSIQDNNGQPEDFEWKYYNAVALQMADGRELLGRRLSKEFPGMIKSGIVRF